MEIASISTRPLILHPLTLDKLPNEVLLEIIKRIISTNLHADPERFRIEGKKNAATLASLGSTCRKLRLMVENHLGTATRYQQRAIAHLGANTFPLAPDNWLPPNLPFFDLFRAAAYPYYLQILEELRSRTTLYTRRQTSNNSESLGAANTAIAQ
ncbi:MAG: hypothetical protein LVR00_09810 [Rhabdochlamydiaceae bacterium]|jgi:hypothetical protein